MAGRIRIGTSGWDYPHWRGVLYPEGLPRRRWFGHFARRFAAVEINRTFWSLPAATEVDRWRREAPAGFRHALKFSRFGTQLKKLRDPEATLPPFLERAERLKSFLGPILVQLPPSLGRDEARLDAFLTAAPKRHRWAVEFRNEAWLTDGVLDLLRRHGAALVVHDLLRRHPRVATTDFVYRRYHGKGYGGRYSPQRLGADARWLDDLSRDGVDAWVFFNNDAGGAAVRDAAALERYLSIRSGRSSGSRRRR